MSQTPKTLQTEMLHFENQKCGPVQSNFRLNENDVTRKASNITFYADNEIMPLTSYRGPHSDRIHGLLDASPKFVNFANGVDERAVYSYTRLVDAMDYADCSDLNEEQPLVFALYDEGRDCYELALVAFTQTDNSSIDPKFELRVYALLDVGYGRNGPFFIEYHADMTHPITMECYPFCHGLKADIASLDGSNRELLGEVVNRLRFVEEVFSDPSTYMTVTTA